MLSTHLLRLANAWLPEAAVERVIEPLLADGQREVELAGGRLRRGLSVAHTATAFAQTVVLALVAELRRPLPPTLTMSTVACVTGFVMAGQALTYYPMFGLAPLPVPWRLHVSMTAVTVSLALLPLAMLKGRDRIGRLAVLRAWAAATAILVLLLGWSIPDSNQRWREAAATVAGVTGPVPKAERELTLPELLWQVPPDATTTTSGVQRERSSRLAVLVMPLNLTTLGLALAPCARRRRAPAAIAAWALIGAVWLYSQGVATGAWAPWFPHAAFLLAALTLPRLRSLNDDAGLPLG